MLAELNLLSTAYVCVGMFLYLGGYQNHNKHDSFDLVETFFFYLFFLLLPTREDILLKNK